MGLLLFGWRNQNPTCDKENLSHVAENPLLGMSVPEMTDKSHLTEPIDTAIRETATDLGLALRGPGLNIDRDLLNTYVKAAAPNSIRALRQDIESFGLWCRREKQQPFPASHKQVADWLKYRADEGAAPASLVRYKASIAKAHRLLGLDDPTKHELCRLAIAAHRDVTPSFPPAGIRAWPRCCA